MPGPCLLTAGFFPAQAPVSSTMRELCFFFVLYLFTVHFLSVITDDLPLVAEVVRDVVVK